MIIYTVSKYWTVDTLKESGDDLSLLLGFQKERIVAIVGSELTISDIYVVTTKCADEFERLVSGVQPVRGKADDQKTNCIPLESFTK